jgi:hypothetical protein
VPLWRALGPSGIPLASFIGAIDPAGYYYAMEPLRDELVPVVALGGLALLAGWVMVRPWSRLLKVAMLSGVAALAIACLHEVLGGAELHPRLGRSVLLFVNKATTNLVLYLPLVVFWVALPLLLLGRVPRQHQPNLRSLLFTASLLFLTQYPRMDETHLLFSGPLIWIVGAYLLWLLRCWMTRGVPVHQIARPQRLMLYLIIGALPFAAVWPSLELRRKDLVVRDSAGTFTLTTARLSSLDLPGARVSELEEFVGKYQALADFFRTNSAPSDRIFVYPAVPLLYYLVDRPNATRFNHIFPGLLTPEDERETIERLWSTPAAFVVWDVFGADYWGKPGMYQALTDFIWEWYEPVADIGGFAVLRLRGS